MCASGKRRAISMPTRARRSPGWRRSRATARSTKCAASRPVSLEDMPEGFEPAADEIDPLAARDRSEQLSALIDCLEVARRGEARRGPARLLSRRFSREAIARRVQPAGPDRQDLAAPRPRPTQGLSGVMSLSPEDDFSAAEFALGTLDPGERATLAARRLREPELDAAIRAWEERSSPLAEAVAADRAAARLFRRDPGAHSRRRRARRAAPMRTPSSRAAARVWRAGARRAIAAREPRRRCWRSASSRAKRRATTPPHEFVAVLQKSPDSPAFAVTRQPRHARVHRAAGLGARASGQVLRTLDHRRQARRAALARRDRRRRRSRAPTALGASMPAPSSPTRPMPSPSSRPAARPTASPRAPPVFVGKLIPVGP